MEGEETVVDNEQCEGKNEDEHKILGPSTEVKSADSRMELSISETENRNVMDMQEPLKVGENETTVDESSLELNRRIAKSATNSQSQNSTAIDETENGDIIDTDNLEQAGHGALGVLQSDQENDPTQKNSTVFLSGATVDSNTCSGGAVSAAPWDEYKPKLPSKPTESSSTPTKPAGVDDTDGGACAIPSHPGLLSPVAAASAMCQGPSSDSRKPVESVYHIKWIRFKNKPLPIVTQNENGPCPLIAIMNVLFLSEKIKLPSIMQMVTSDQLMEYLGDYIFEHAPKEITDDARLNYEQNMHDAMAVFHKLQTGLDVNVRFTGVSDFEYTPECIVFDLLHIPLYHGWLVDPQDDMTVMAVTNCSYNQLVEKIIVQKSSDKQELVTEALTAEAFLESSMSQLTYHGLSELQSTVKEQEMTVFFRNNHFSTIYKNKNELFLLVTDQGFLTESNVVWESLSNVEGDGHFVDADFRSFQKAEPSSLPISTPSVPPGTDQQVDQDYLVALSLDQEQSTSSAPVSWQDSGLSDHDLAMQLQEEENRRAAAAAGQQGAGPAQQPVAPRAPLGGRSAPQPTTAGGSQRKKDKSDCIII